MGQEGQPSDGGKGTVNVDGLYNIRPVRVNLRSVANCQLLKNGLVALGIHVLQIRQEPSTLSHNSQQPAPR